MAVEWEWKFELQSKTLFPTLLADVTQSNRRILFLTVAGYHFGFQGTVVKGLGTVKFVNKVINFPVHIPD